MPYVYAIKHKASGYIYVGCTKGKLAKRMREHRCLLNQGRHSCPLMQVDWNRDGEDGFEITPLESLPEDANVVLKRVRELYWMQVHAEKLYNQHQTSFAPQPWAIAKGVAAAAELRRGTKNSPESNKKRRLAQIGLPKGHGAKISATKRAKRDQLRGI